MPRRRIRPCGLVTLLTDFGSQDAYVASMKGVILTLCPKAVLVDMCHEVPAHDVIAGALQLRSAVDHFPAGTIHVAVVDPGVGGTRRPLAFRCADRFLVGPDNGLLSLALSTPAHCVHLTNERYFRRPVSATFQGRDLFAPVAAHLACGVALSQFGPEVTDWNRLALPSPESSTATLKGQVIHIDRFGNLMTNIDQATLQQWLAATPCECVAVRVGGRTVDGLVSTYADVSRGHTLALLGSAGYLEIATREGNAAERLRAGRGAKVTIRRRHSAAGRLSP